MALVSVFVNIITSVSNYGSNSGIVRVWNEISEGTYSEYIAYVQNVDLASNTHLKYFSVWSSYKTFSI